MHQACNENIDSKFLFGLSELTDSVTIEKKFLKQNGNLFQDGNLDFDNYTPKAKGILSDKCFYLFTFLFEHFS